MKKIRLFDQRLIANILGNALEWYDFALYGGLASFIAHHFFPAKNFFISMMLTFGTFAAGFLMRPLGGIFFGHIGDTQGRRKALLLSIGLMVLPTILLGLTPGYATIGIAAPICIILIRLFQGLAIGGEFTGTMVYLDEIAPQQQRGFYASFASFGIFCGIILGPLSIYLISKLQSADTFAAWGWRLPFLASAFLGVLVFYLRTHFKESATLPPAKSAQPTALPLVTCFKEHKLALLTGCGASILVGISFWITMIYNITYFNKVLHYDFSHAILINLIMILVAAITVPLIGKLSERVALPTLLRFFAICFFLLSLPINFILLAPHTSPLLNFIMLVIVALETAGYLAAIPGFLATLFPASIRYSGVSIAYNTALAIFGGTAPLAVTYLLKENILFAPGLVLTLGAFISFNALLLWAIVNRTRQVQSY